MGTRSNIGILENRRVKYIYCHYDGYIDGVGRTLIEHYTDVEKIRSLIELGDISVLGERVNPIGEHSFEKREEGTTVFYHRDRGESWEYTKPREQFLSDLKRGYKQEGYCDIEYTYIYDVFDETWYYFIPSGDQTLKELSKCFPDMKSEEIQNQEKTENVIEFYSKDGEPIIQLKEGKFIYKGQEIDDIFQVYYRFAEFLKK